MFKVKASAVTHSDGVRLQSVSILIVGVRAKKFSFVLTLVVQTLKQIIQNKTNQWTQAPPPDDITRHIAGANQLASANRLNISSDAGDVV